MKNFFRRNGFWLLVIAFLLSVLIGISTALMGGNADPLSDLVSTITAPIRGGVSAVADWAGGVSRYVLHYGEMEQELQDLEKKVAEEIIDSYGEVTVTASEDDPTVCLVEFSFAVAHGLNQIYLMVHITV